MASRALPLDSDEVMQLLEVKDVARLYEIWCAFRVVDAVRMWRGTPVEAARIGRDDLGADVRAGLLVTWADGTEIAYNATYSAAQGFHGRSWSLSLRPDVALWVPSGPSRGLHLFDAKFRIATAGPISTTLEGDTDIEAKAADIHKMHAYCDAVPDARSAWVLYPGQVFRAWNEGGAGKSDPLAWPPGSSGVGAVPLLPTGDRTALDTLVRSLLSG
jgi:hypothetical protein